MKILTLIALISCVGCATAKLSEKGNSVRITTSTPQNCKYIGSVSGEYGKWDYYGEAPKKDLEILLKNKAAEAGANTVEMIGHGTHDVRGEAYRCEN